MNKKFWKNKRVLITGHTGFKGSWLTLILSNFKAKIYGYALNPITSPNFFDDAKLSQFLEEDIRANIMNYNKLSSSIKNINPDIIFHLAAQSSVLVSYLNPIDTINTNILGTINLLEATRNINSIKSLVIVTTDKVYLNLDQKKIFKEKDHLGGHDIYSASKASCEIITNSYKNSFFKNKKCNIATARSGNCIGGGDFTKDRIIKDCAEAFLDNNKLKIRNPNATRPWQHVIEPLFGYIKLAEKLYKNNFYEGAWNFGPKNKNNLKVIDVAKYGRKFLKSNSIIEIKNNKFYESSNLSLNSYKSLKFLNWKTKLSAKQAIKLSFSWYAFFKTCKSSSEIIEFTFKQIKNYLKIIR